MIGLVASLGMGWAFWAYSQRNSIEGCYDTSIVGAIRESAFIEVRGTNVWLWDGHNERTSLGRIDESERKPIWRALGGTSWSLDKLDGRLRCVDIGNPTNIFLLKPVLFARTRDSVRRLAEKVGLVDPDF